MLISVDKETSIFFTLATANGTYFKISMLQFINDSVSQVSTLQT